MPPEQLRGERVDARADLFALGCVLFEMLAGTTPYKAPTEDEQDTLLSRLESGRYPRVRSGCRDAPRVLTRLIRKCLQPRATRRIASAAEVRRRLEVLLDRPSGMDCRARLAAFFWERHVFEPRPTETVVMVARASSGTMPRAVRVGFASAALVASLFCFALSMRYPDQVVQWTDSVAPEVRTLLLAP